MAKDATISYRGTGYEIGLGRNSYAIWAVGAPRSEPLAWWPETPEGWSAAWARFTAIEAPGTIAPVGKRTFSFTSMGTGRSQAPSARFIAAGLIAAGVVLEVIGLFPSYIGGSSVESQPPNLLPHVFYLAALAIGAALIASGGARARMGALLATGVSIVTFGLFFADAGEVISGGARLLGAGLVICLVGWVVGAFGSLLAFRLQPVGAPARPRPQQFGTVALLILAGLGAACAFAPSWDSYVLRFASSGASQTLTGGNAFANPGWMIVGDVAVMVALAIAVTAAALWRPSRQAAALLLGALVPMAGQAVSALVGVGEPTPPSQFGISQAQASQAGLTITNGLTPAFWIYCMFVLILLVSCVWLALPPHLDSSADAGEVRTWPVWNSAGPTATTPVSGTVPVPGITPAPAETRIAETTAVPVPDQDEEDPVLAPGGVSAEQTQADQAHAGDTHAGEQG